MNWQPIESAPKNTDILLYWHDNVWIGRFYQGSGYWSLCDYGGFEDGEDAPTHWMPLPEPPSSSATITDP